MPSHRRSPEAQHSRSALQVLVPWLLAGILLFVLACRLEASWNQAVAADLRFSAGWLVASLGLLGSYLLMRALLWHRLTLTVGVGIPLERALAAWFSSQAGKYIPGKIFLYLGRVYLYGREGRNATLVSLAFALETILSAVAALIMALSFGVPQRLPGVPASLPWVLWAGVFVIFGALHPGLLEGVMGRVARIFGLQSPWKLPSWGTLAGSAALYVLSWGICGLGFYSFLQSFYPLSPAEIAFVSGSFSLAAVLGMIVVFVPAGLGVREGVLALLLGSILPEGVAVAGALLARAWFLAGELVGLGVSYFLRWSKVGWSEGERPDGKGK